MNALADEALVTLAQRGDAGAFARLVRRHHDQVSRLLMRSGVGGARDDLVQDVFLQAYRQLGGLREVGAFKGWLMQLAVNRARGWRRRAAIERRAIDRLAVRATPARREDPLERAEQVARVREAMRGLPQETWEMLAMRFEEGLKAPEIAERVGLSPAAVRQRLSRALRQLKDEVGA